VDIVIIGVGELPVRGMAMRFVVELFIITRLSEYARKMSGVKETVIVSESVPFTVPLAIELVIQCVCVKSESRESELIDEFLIITVRVVVVPRRQSPKSIALAESAIAGTGDDAVSAITLRPVDA
jgi:hypothetical protein